MESEPHTRARALRIGYGGTIAWMLLLTVAVALAAQEPEFVLFVVPAFSVALVASALFADLAGLLPRGRRLGVLERRALRIGMGGLPVLGLALLLAVAAGATPAEWILYTAGLVGLLAGSGAMVALLRG